MAERDIYSDIWNGKRVRFDRNFRGCRLTDEECEKLCNNEVVVVRNLKSRQKDEIYSVAVNLADKKDDGCNAYVNVDHFISRGIPKTFCEHTFTDDERLMLENGMVVHLDMCYSKKSLRYFDCDIRFDSKTGKIEFV